jgi:hypothetical protein
LPGFWFNKAFKVAQDIRVFINLECGATRGLVPDPKQLKTFTEQIEKQRLLLGKQNREITRLKMRLSTLGASTGISREGGRVRRYPDGGSQTGALPDFLIIGAQKSGTTFLYNLLCQHPQGQPALEKEVHFFDINFDKGVDWYRSFFPPPTWMDGQRSITGEASPYYLFHPHAARRAAAVVPHARLIALLRNPIDRAYSDYQHKAREGRDLLSFEDAISAEEERLRGEREKMLVDETYSSQNYRKFSYLSRGVYVDQIAEWRRYFDEDQMLVLKSEDFFEDPQGTFERVSSFLGLPHWETGAVGERNEGEYQRMGPATRRRLQDYFEPHNKRLYEFLGVDLDW